MLERLVYISAAAEQISEQMVEHILDVSRARNAAAGVTGLLIGGSNWWMQVLEGELPRLEPIWASIRSDARHSPVVLVQRRPRRSRSFGDWSLQFQWSSDEAFEERLLSLTEDLSEPRLKEQVREFHRLFLRPPGRGAWDEAHLASGEA